MTLDQIKSLPFVFIIGRARSGTTLLQTILDTSPEMIFPLESRLILFLRRKYQGQHSLTPAFINSFLNDLYMENKFRNHWKVNRETLEHALLHFKNHKISFQTLCKIIYLQYSSIFDKSAVSIIGDKNPMYSRFITTLVELFPDAKFIHLVRNPKDNIVSHKDVFGVKNVAVLAQGWICYNRSIEIQKMKFPGKFITIKYEDMVSNPNEIVSEVARHLNTKPDQVKLDLNLESNEKYHTRLESKEFRHFHKNLLKPVNTSQVEKWHSRLSKEEVQLIDYITCEYAAIYNYPTGPRRKKISYVIRARMAKLQYSFYNKSIDFYYNSPMLFRKITRKVSKWLNEKCNYSNYFNTGDYRFQDEYDNEPK